MSAPTSIDSKVLELELRDTIARAVFLSYLLSILFAVYGFTSLAFIERFTQVHLYLNVIPRLVFNSVPLFFLGRFLSRSNMDDRQKLTVWITIFSIVLHVSAWIYIWPVALWVSGQIMTYVHAANAFLFLVTFIGVAPPTRYLLKFTLILVAIFVVPLFVVVYLTGDHVIFNVVFNDTVTAIAAGIIYARILNKLRNEVARLKIEKELEAAKFLGPVVSQAIFSDQISRLDKTLCKGFVLSIDIRDSTLLQQQLKEKWLEFRRSYFKLVAKLVADHRGYIQKTVGDCHVINFGIMDYGPDLSDIPGIESELARAEERRLAQASTHAFNFVEELFVAFAKLAEHELPEFKVRLGAGIDKGWVERGVQGDESSQLELDVNGDPVNCSNRLQEFSKVVRDRLNWDASILVVSPYASDYLDDLSAFQKLVMNKEQAIRNYPNIAWVLVRKYLDDKSASDNSAA